MQCFGRETPDFSPGSTSCRAKLRVSTRPWIVPRRAEAHRLARHDVLPALKGGVSRHCPILFPAMLTQLLPAVLGGAPA